MSASRRNKQIEVLHRAVTEPVMDKLEIGTPGKGGVITVHGHFDNPEEFQKLIDSAVMLRRYAVEQMRKEELS